MPALPLLLTLRVPQLRLAALRLPPLTPLAQPLPTLLDRPLAPLVAIWADSSRALVAAAQQARLAALEVFSEAQAAWEAPALALHLEASADFLVVAVQLFRRAALRV